MSFKDFIDDLASRIPDPQRSEFAHRLRERLGLTDKIHVPGAEIDAIRGLHYTEQEIWPLPLIKADDQSAVKTYLLLPVSVGEILAALPAGDNNIGDVDIASALPAGNNNIGDVDIASALPAGNNNIGDVDNNVQNYILNSDNNVYAEGSPYFQITGRSTVDVTASIIIDTVAGVPSAQFTGATRVKILTMILFRFGSGTFYLEALPSRRVILPLSYLPSSGHIEINSSAGVPLYQLTAGADTQVLLTTTGLGVNKEFSYLLIGKVEP